MGATITSNDAVVAPMEAIMVAPTGGAMIASIKKLKI